MHPVHCLDLDKRVRIERNAIIIFQSDVSFDAFSPGGIISPRPGGFIYWNQKRSKSLQRCTFTAEEFKKCGKFREIELFQLSYQMMVA